MKFDVRTEAWIPVRTVKGEEKMVGLLELFQDAPCFQDIDGETPMETYSLYRFLATFLMTVFRPETWEDKNELLSAGCFDPLLWKKKEKPLFDEKKYKRS